MRLFHRFAFFAAVLAISFISNAEARIVKQAYKISSGTGFFVSNMGYVVTNEHVVRGCDKVVLQGTVLPIEGEVRATDPAHDLALIFTRRTPRITAPLRENIGDIHPGERVLVMGYPGDAGLTGRYVVVEAKMVSVSGTPGHPEWIQFSDAAQQGNSGGPLLDSSGNVIGVVVGKSQTYEVNKVNGERRLVSNADEAISLETVKTFLQQHGVYFRGVGSGIQLDNKRIEYMAREFIVNVQCRIPVSETETTETGMKRIEIQQ